jgi:hypothetical protein
MTVAQDTIDNIVSKYGNAGNPDRAAEAARKREEQERKKQTQITGKQHKESQKSEIGIAGKLLIWNALLKKVLAQSKIYNAVMNTLNKLMGLLVDVILMPFLPLIMAGLVFLAEKIMDFNEVWGKTVTPALTRLGEKIDEVMHPKKAEELGERGPAPPGVFGFLLNLVNPAEIDAALRGVPLLGWLYSIFVPDKKVSEVDIAITFDTILKGIWVSFIGLGQFIIDIFTGKYNKTLGLTFDLDTVLTGLSKTWAELIKWAWESHGGAVIQFELVPILNIVGGKIWDFLMWVWEQTGGRATNLFKTPQTVDVTSGNTGVENPINYYNTSSTSNTVNTNVGGASSWDQMGRTRGEIALI